jgi:hypothetical protein
MKDKKTNTIIREMLKKSVGKLTILYPNGNYLFDSTPGILERKSGGFGVNTGWHVDGMQIPISAIHSAIKEGGTLMVGVSPDYFDRHIRNQRYHAHD